MPVHQEPAAFLEPAVFRDRAEAGRRLAASHLQHLRGQDVVVAGLTRGGVPVAFEVARALGAPLDVIVVRKLGLPFQPEVAMGAVAEGGVRLVDPAAAAGAMVNPNHLRVIEDRARAEVHRLTARLGELHGRYSLAGRTVVIVDDAFATGATAQAACRVVRARAAGRVLLAAPVASHQAILRLKADADEVIATEVTDEIGGIGHWYTDFAEASDDDVVRLLERDAGTPAESQPPRPPISTSQTWIPAGDADLPAVLSVPDGADGLIIAALVSADGRHSARSRTVARSLNDAGLATLLLDLVDRQEEARRAALLDLRLLGRRLALATREARAGFRWIGYLGAEHGAAVAVWAAGEPDCDVAALVSRGGRPDLAGARLNAVRAPTLLVVGERDPAVLRLNRQALARLPGVGDLVVIPGAGHLFAEPGTLAAATASARDWFLRHAPRPDEQLGSGVNRVLG